MTMTRRPAALEIPAVLMLSPGGSVTSGRSSTTSPDVFAEYRQAKCEVTTELLAELWHLDPFDYDLPKLLRRKWSEALQPIIVKGLEWPQVVSDLQLHQWF